MDADEFPHPPWCSPRRCTAADGPVNGHGVGAHRSAPEASGLIEAYVVQTPEGAPSVELARMGRSLPMTSTEAGGLGDALAELLSRTGLTAGSRWEPGA